MKIAVIGAGAIGAVLATAAADSGHEVIVCVRTPIDSLVVVRGDEELTPAVHIVSNPPAPGAARPADIVWLTTKATDTPAAAGWFNAFCGPDTLVVSAHNGLDQSAHARPHVPAVVADDRIAVSLAYMAAERLAPGRVRHLAGGLLVTSTDVQPVLEAAVGAGGITVDGTDDMLTASWRKLFGNLVANPITALTMRRITVMREPDIADLARAILIEALAVARAEGADLSDEHVEQTVAGTARYGPETGSSMYYDRMAGQPLEHEFLTGEVVRRAGTHGIPAPINTALLALLRAIDQAHPGRASDGT